MLKNNSWSIMKFYERFVVTQIIVLIFLLPSIYIAQGSGGVTGTVVGILSNEPLVGANIMVGGTVIGAAADIDGKFRINNIPIGSQNIKCSYIGYKSKSVTINIISNKIIEIKFELASDVLLGEDVVVTGILEGQQRAINQQLTANTIVNIVSKDKIEELPDQNAAETVGRLPGISIQRDAGEGSKVVVRGLSPKFNSITLNGERIPSTDPEDRSVDLTMISSDMLAGIEVFKSLTADKDGDAIGGTVNFITKKAPKKFKGDFRIQLGHNNIRNEYTNFKTNISLSNRFFDNKLGLLFSGNYQNVNRGSDLFDGGYATDGVKEDGSARIIVNNINLGHRTETRKRYGASLAMDYALENGSLLFNSFYSATDREEVRRRKRYRVGQSYVEYWLRNREINTDLFTNSLSGQHLFESLTIDWRTSYSTTSRDIPLSHDSQFRELAAFNNNLIEDQGPKLIPLGAKNKLDATFFKQDFLDNDITDDKDFTAQLDFKYDFSLGNNIAGYFKGGGKYRNKDRSRDKTQFFTSAFAINDLGAANSDLFALTSERKIKISNFYDNSFDPNNFLDGQYEFGPGLDVDLLQQFSKKYSDLYLNNNEVDLEDYEAGEQIIAGYLMTEINIGPQLMFLPGIRYEKTINDFQSVIGRASSSDDRGAPTIIGRTDTLGGRSYEDFLPMIHLRYKPKDWFDVRLAFTRTLSRPDYFKLVPWERVSVDLVERGEPNLKNTKALNYDLFLSFYNNYGLFTLGGFYKTLVDIDYIRTNRIQDPGPNLGKMLTQPVNADGETKVYGFEIELQTNLRWLPSPFDGFVLYANLSVIKSETFFPLFLIGERSKLPPYSPIIIDTVRAGRMPGQADKVANLSIGYEKGNFTGRVSMIYQGSALQYVGTISEEDGYTDASIRWDFTMQYEFIKGLSMFFNLNNFSNTPEKAFLGIESFPTREEYYGWTGDLGVRYKF
jgi:TonB-dependent receptor